MSEQFKTLPERIQALSDATSCSSLSLTSVEQTKGFQIIAFVDSCFGDSQCEIDACGLIAAMLIAFAKARSDPFTFHYFATRALHDGLERCIAILVQRGERLPVVAYALIANYIRWTARRREMALAAAFERLRLYPTLPNMLIWPPKRTPG